MVKKEITIHEIIGLTDSIRVGVRTDLADIYLKEAERLSTTALESLIKSIETKEREEKQRLCFQERKNSIIAIILSVFALEAYINKIGYDYFGEKFKSVERKSFIEKWISFPKEINNKTFDEKQELFINFKKIKTWRDSFAHYKMYDYNPVLDHPSGLKVPEIYKIANGENAILSVRVAIDMIQEIEKMLKG